MGKTKRKAEKAAKSVLGAEAAKAHLKPKSKAPKEAKSEAKTSKTRDSIQQPAARAEPPWRNKEKPLVLCARGITFRYRHLMTDLMQLIPHHKTDSKLDTKHDWNVINEVAELKNATTAMFFEARKKKDLYIWLSKVPCGPCVRFYCTNIHTMAELKLSGNHLKGSRPVVTFDAAFNEQPHLQVMKELLQQVFVTPKGHPKSKPFFDHVISFSYCDGRIWLRNYQVITAAERKELKSEGSTLVEVGPRVTLQPIKVFAGSFRGKVLFENPEFIHPNAVRSYEKKKEAGVYKRRKDREAAARDHKAANILPKDDLSNKHVFAAAAAQGDDSSDADVLDEELLETDGDVLQHASIAGAGSDVGAGTEKRAKSKSQTAGVVTKGKSGKGATAASGHAQVEKGSDAGEEDSEGELGIDIDGKGFIYSASEDDDLEGSGDEEGDDDSDDMEEGESDEEDDDE